VAKGSCLCGAIRFEVDEAGIVLGVSCFCTKCRKVSGTQNGVYFQVKRRAFRWICGDDAVGRYESSPGNHRAFCKTCGSIAPIETYYGAVRVPGGAFDEDPAVKAQVNLFAADKAAWCDIDAAARNFDDSGPEDFWRGVIVQLHT
jgi:hypothetical protein